MTKNYFTTIVAVFIVASMFTSCNSTKRRQPDMSELSTATSDETDKNLSIDNPQKMTVISGGTYYKFGTGSIFVYTFSGSIAQKKITFLMRTDKKMAGFQVRYNNGLYNIFFTQEGLQKLAGSTASYYNDFENKNLDRKNHASYKIYGTTESYFEWGTISNVMPNSVNTEAQLGYEFVKKSPYFTITYWPADNNAYKNGMSKIKQSMALHFYCTKSQAKIITDMLQKEKIQSKIEQIETDKIGGKIETEDQY